jgi:hypothetical protein
MATAIFLALRQGHRPAYGRRLCLRPDGPGRLTWELSLGIHVTDSRPDDGEADICLSLCLRRGTEYD